MDNKKLGTILSIAGIGLSAVATVVGGIISSKQTKLEIDSKVTEKVAEALSKQN